MLLSTQCSLFQGRPCIYQQANAKLHTVHALQQYWFALEEHSTGLPVQTSPDLSQTENTWHIVKWKIQQGHFLKQPLDNSKPLLWMEGTGGLLHSTFFFLLFCLATFCPLGFWLDKIYMVKVILPLDFIFQYKIPIIQNTLLHPHWPILRTWW